MLKKKMLRQVKSGDPSLLLDKLAKLQVAVNLAIKDLLSGYKQHYSKTMLRI